MLLGEKWSRTDLGHVLLHPFPTHNVYKKAVNRIIFLVQGDTNLIRCFQSIHSNHPSLACVNFFKEIKLEVLVSYFRFSHTIPAGCFSFCDCLTAISFDRIQSDKHKTWNFRVRNKRRSTSTQITNDCINHCACSKKACRAASWATFAHPQHPLETHYSRSSKNITLCAKHNFGNDQSAYLVAFLVEFARHMLAIGYPQHPEEFVDVVFWVAHLPPERHWSIFPQLK